MNITCLGHACFLVETSRARLLIDPYLDENPAAVTKA
ncbi:MAG: Beta-lactamase superfamily domain, partial [Verrucomicrobiota bacterium]